MNALMKNIKCRAAALAIPGVVLAGCGGHSSSNTSTPPPGVPAISNLRLAYAAGTCTLAGQPGRPLTETVQYADSDGDVEGGTLETTAIFHPSGQSVDVNFILPSNSATISGTTDGSITAFACVVFNGNTSLGLSVVLLDKAGHSSNILSAALNAEVPRALGSHEMGPAGLEALRP